ncbi:hypothetical protein GOBAR_DD22377 [Gossypium barbadense]|nr:hypothetical protein GOBAR_DD22377 [Gossypium barbadense]
MEQGNLFLLFIRPVSGDAEASIRDLPPSAIGDPSNLDAMGLLATNKVRDGSTVRVYLLPDFQFVQVFVTGIQSPSMGRRAVAETVVETDLTSDVQNGDASTKPWAALTSVQKLFASAPAAAEVSYDPFRIEAKHFTEVRYLNRDVSEKDFMSTCVRIVLEGVDKFSNLIGSVYYHKCETGKDLVLELVENAYYQLNCFFGSTKYVEWSANMMEDDAKQRLKAAELEAKKTRLRIWTNYVPLVINSKAIRDQNFIGKVVEVVSGDCIVVCRVNLSSIRCPKIRNPRRDEKPTAYAREAREFLKTHLIGKQMTEEMEYSRKVSMTDGTATPGLAQLCSLAFLKVPSLDDEFGTKAAQFLSEQTLGSLLQFKAVKEEKDTSWGKVKGQGTGTCLVVTLFTEDPDDSINDAMLKV